MHRAELEQHLPNQARLLVVEDNRINQVVLQGVLANINMKADIAGNGVEAIELLKNCPEDAKYELIIMDCQMPELDGYETTKAIRAGKATEAYLDIPIIAMTANAMKGDEEKCLSAGMSDYATKPINPDVLQQKLCHWLGEREHYKAEPSTDNSSNNGHPKQINSTANKSDTIEKQDHIWLADAFLARMRNNKALAQKLVALYLEESPAMVAEIITATKNKDNKTLVATSHKLKGSTFNLAGNRFAHIIAEVETCAKELRFDQISLLESKINIEFEQFILELKNFVNS